MHVEAALRLFATPAQRETAEAEIAKWRSEYPDNTVSASVRTGTLDGEPVLFFNVSADTEPYSAFLAGSLHEDGSWVSDEEIS